MAKVNSGEPWYKSVVTWIGGIAAALIIAAGSSWVTYWVNSKPTPASIMIRPSSIDMLNTDWVRYDKKQGKFVSSSTASLVISKSGDGAAGYCHLQMKTDRGIFDEQIMLYLGNTLEGNVDSLGETFSLEFGPNEVQRRVLFEAPLGGGAPFTEFEVVSFQLNCENAVSEWETFPLADRLCQLDDYRLPCIQAGWKP